jgi:hypothetical protein
MKITKNYLAETLSNSDATNTTEDFYAKAIQELDSEFPGATYDESLNSFIYQKGKLQYTFLIILSILIGPLTFLLIYLLVPDYTFKSFILTSTIYILILICLHIYIFISTL